MEKRSEGQLADLQPAWIISMACPLSYGVTGMSPQSIWSINIVLVSKKSLAQEEEKLLTIFAPD